MRHKLLRNTSLGMLRLSLGVGLTSANGPIWTMPHTGSTPNSGAAFIVSNSNGFVADFWATNPNSNAHTLSAFGLGTGRGVYGVSHGGDGVYGYM
jgi:hypothetical protein